MARIKPGQRFGKWTTQNTEIIVRPSGRRVTKWRVECECGAEQTVASYDLNKGKSTQCMRCYGKDTKDLSGRRFGSWLVKGLGVKKNRKTHWHCVCDCGREDNVCGASLTKGVSVRCVGCYYKTMPKHGYTCKGNRHPLYDTWMAMLARCENKKSISYENYGFRGIEVCAQWHDLEAFASDMGDRPEGHSLDRIDNDGNYEPGNVKWSSSSEQANNRRTNRTIEHGEETKTVSQWAEFLGVATTTLFKYLERNSFGEAYAFYGKRK